MTTIVAKDLTREFPRSPYAQLEGYVWLPRLIDKVRALHAGTLGDYTPFPCGGDKNFLGTVGLDADALSALIKAGATDEEVVAWVKANQAPNALEKLEGYRKTQFQPTAAELQEYLKGAVAELSQARPDLDVSHIDNFAKLICTEEGHAIPTA